MTTVALESSTRRGSVALSVGDGADGETLADELDAEVAHASDLVARLDALLARAGRAPGDVVRVLVGTGPGSFTGLRVAVATALGIARGTGAGVRGVSSVEAAVFAELAPGEEACAVLYARAGELYFARYRRLADEIEAVVAPRVVPADERPPIPDGARVLGDAAGARAAGLDPERVTSRVPSARDVLELGRLRWRRLGPQEPDEITPLYLRPFAARKRSR